MAMNGFIIDQKQLEESPLAAQLQQQWEEAAAANKQSPSKLHNGWHEALAEYLQSGDGLYIPRLIHGWVECEQQQQQQQQQRRLEAEAGSRKRGKVCVLSIDGGGMRGIIPAKILSHLERSLQRKSGDPGARIVDYFDVVAGTNVGGIIATMLFTGNGKEEAPLFTAEEAWKYIAEKGKAIFSSSSNHEKSSSSHEKSSSKSSKNKKGGFWGRLFQRSRKNTTSSTNTSTSSSTCSRPKFSAEGLERSLGELLVAAAGRRPLTLRDTLKPVLVPCYDLATAAPFLFSRAGALESAAWDFRLADVCRAAAATPGLFPPAAVASVDGSTRCTAVDAGLVMNSPAAAAMTHVLHNGAEFPGVRDAGDVLLLSLGTGQFERRYGAGAEEAQWGPCQWARPAAGIVLENVSDMVDHMLAMAFAAGGARRDNYLRLQAVMPASESEVAEMDDASDENVRRLARMADEVLEQMAMEHLGFGGRRALQQTNAEQLDWFADQLIEEHRARLLRSSPTVVLKKPH